MILAVGETFDLDFCRASGLELKEEGTIVVDRFTLETSRPGFYAGGDVITGASNVSNAMGGGKQAARKIDERLMGEQSSHTAARRRVSPASAVVTRRTMCPQRSASNPRKKSLPVSVRKRRLRNAAGAFVVT